MVADDDASVVFFVLSGHPEGRAVPHPLGDAWRVARAHVDVIVGAVGMALGAGRGDSGPRQDGKPPVYRAGPAPGTGPPSVTVAPGSFRPEVRWNRTRSDSTSMLTSSGYP